MARPDHAYIRAQALKFVSAERGSCDHISKELCIAAYLWSNAPRRYYPIHALIRCDYAQNHIAMAALWTGDADDDWLIVDPSIAQFGGDPRVFIGTVAEWLAELGQLHNGAPAELDPGGRNFNKAWLSAPAEAKTAAVHQEQRRSSRVSQDSHMAETVKDTKPCCGCVVM